MRHLLQARKHPDEQVAPLITVPQDQLLLHSLVLRSHNRLRLRALGRGPLPSQAQQLTQAVRQTLHQPAWHQRVV